MAKISVKNIDGKKIEDLTLSDDVFGVEHNATLLHQVYTVAGANRRTGNAHTKTRGERRGGGKKPWKQKGTGNARTGSIRNPIWRGGGVIFGPRNTQNFAGKINIKMRQKATKIALSDKVRDEKIIVIDVLTLDDVKTSAFAKILKNLDLTQSVLVGFGKEEAKFHRALRNIPRTNGIPVEQINTYDLMNAEFVLLSKESIKSIEQKYKA